MNLENILPFLKCPKSNGKLFLEDGKLKSAGGETYPIVNGKPILVENIENHHITPPVSDIISQNQATYKVPDIGLTKTCRILHIGSGNVPSEDSRVISLDILPCENVDIVAEAESLPFFDETFDYVESGAVFEHLYDPLTAIKEIKRVLKPTGSFRIDTAFMQSYHGFPQHYFNMTPQAIETFLVNDFILEEAYVPDSATPLVSIVSLLERFLSYLSKTESEKLKKLSVEEMIHLMKTDPTRSNHLLSNFSEYGLRSMAASYVVHARKPVDWVNSDHNSVDDDRVIRRKYYTLRQEVILRHHELFLYRRMSFEAGYSENNNILAPEPIHLILLKGKVHDPSDISQFKKATDFLRDIETSLQNVRNQWIGIYLLMLEESKAEE